MFDRFFDCMNTRRLTEGKEKRKPDLDPYRSPNDARLTLYALSVQMSCVHAIEESVKHFAKFASFLKFLISQEIKCTADRTAKYL